MRTRTLLLGIIFISSIAPIAGDRARQAPDEALLVELQARIDAYVALHRKLEGPVPTVQVSADPGEVRRAMDALAVKIRAARRGAKQGDVFSPAIAGACRRVIARCVKDAGADALATVNEESAGLEKLPLRINERYPEGAPISMVWPSILCALPPLPDELQYRFAGRTLILWDVHADLIVDLLPGALPAPPPTSQP
jgi:hypothetical protein